MLTRILPKQSFTRDDASRLAHQHGWQYHNIFLPEGRQPFEKVWLTDDGLTSVHWIEDGEVDLNYFLLQGEHQPQVAGAIREDVETVGRDELRSMLDRAEESDEFLSALTMAAVSAPPEFDTEVFEWLERGFTHPRPPVRQAAAILTAYPGWPEFRAPLERLANEDEDDEVRQAAEAMLEDLAAKTASG
jgi:hypothetical protein